MKITINNERGVMPTEKRSYDSTRIRRGKDRYGFIDMTGNTYMMRSLSVATASFRCAPKGDHLAYSKADRDNQSSNPSASHHYASKATFSEHGSKAGTIGGPARAASMTQKQRTTVASNAAKARWSKKSI